MDPLNLLIAIPVHNERKYVEHVLAEVKRHHPDVLVVDDGSTDGTGEILSDLARRGEIQLVRHPINRGYGRSVCDAFAHADAHGYDWVITMDCDEQHEPDRIPDFIREIRHDRWDIISGSRYLHDDPSGDLPPGDRRLINATLTQTINDLFGWSLTDTFCGYKAHRVAAMRLLELDEPGYAFPMQLWPRAYRASSRITEIPVRLIYNDPNRHFGGLLDDAGIRLAHYRDVLRRELVRDFAGARVPVLAGLPDSEGGDGTPVVSLPAELPTRHANEGEQDGNDGAANLATEPLPTVLGCSCCCGHE